MTALGGEGEPIPRAQQPHPAGGSHTGQCGPGACPDATGLEEFLQVRGRAPRPVATPRAWAGAETWERRVRTRRDKAPLRCPHCFLHRGLRSDRLTEEVKRLRVHRDHGNFYRSI